MATWISRLRTKLFGRYLIVTNTVGCGTLMGVGDIIVQLIDKRSNLEKLNAVGETISLSTRGEELDKRLIDWYRVGRMCTIGILLGPFNHGWYTMLDKVLPGQTWKIVGKKIIADQIVASPFFAFTFFIGMGTLEGQKPKASWDEFRSKFWKVYKADWTVWPAAQAINFAYVPNQFRVLYVSVITLGWDTFLSYMKHRDRLEKLIRKASKASPSLHIQPRR